MQDYVTSDRWKQDDIRRISRRLNLTLDAIGFSEKSRSAIADYTVLTDINYNISSAFTDSIYCFVTLGSQREGTTNQWYQSDIDVLFFSPFLNVFVRYMGKARAKDQQGNYYRCIKFRPFLVEGTIFEEGEFMNVYVTDDKNRLPIMVEAEILVGSVKAYLSSTKNVKYPLDSRIK